MEKFQRKMEGGLISLLCSRNARPRKGLVGRAQWETDQATLPSRSWTTRPRGEGKTSELGRSIYSSAEAARWDQSRPSHELTRYLAKSSLCTNSEFHS